MPKRRPVDKDVLDLFVKLKQAPGLSMYDIGDRLKLADPERFEGILARSVYAACEREVCDPLMAATVDGARATLPPPVDLPPILEKLERPYADALLFSDNHLPYHDADVIAEGMTFAKSNKLTTCVLNGDTLDMHAWSNYVNLTGEDSDQAFVQLGQFFVALLDHSVRTILMTYGNHEDRISRQTGGKLHMWSVVGMAIDTLASRDRMRVRKAVTATNRPSLRLTGTPDGIDWVIGHPRRYRGKRLSLAADIALKWAKCHVATGHEHHIGWTVTECGSYYAMNLPTTQAAERTEYLQMDMSPTSRPVKGYGYLIDGKPGLCWERDPEAWKRKALRGMFAKKGKR